MYNYVCDSQCEYVCVRARVFTAYIDVTQKLSATSRMKPIEPISEL